jgi:hypothetical protein
MAVRARSSPNLNNFIRKISLNRGAVFGFLIIVALLAFEVFNYSTTDFAMRDLLGDLRFAGIRWSTILAIAFCGIDFAGIARIFTPEQGADEPSEIWYLLGAWLLAAAMNALLTWWGVAIAISNHNSLGNAVIDRETLIKIVPIFVAVMVWLSRVLIIGTFSVAGERLFSQASNSTSSSPRKRNSAKKSYSRPKPRPAPTFRPVPKTRSEPTYHPMSAKPKPNPNNDSRQRSFMNQN